MADRADHRIHPEIRNRARQLRHPQTPAESQLWSRLRQRQPRGFKFRRQHPIGPFIVDFYCAFCRLVVEIDGDDHAQRMERDAARTDWLNQHCYRVIRFSNQDVARNLDAVLEAILAVCQRFR